MLRFSNPLQPEVCFASFLIYNLYGNRLLDVALIGIFFNGPVWYWNRKFEQTFPIGYASCYTLKGRMCWVIWCMNLRRNYQFSRYLVQFRSISLYPVIIDFRDKKPYTINYYYTIILIVSILRQLVSTFTSFGKHFYVIW